MREGVVQRGVREITLARSDKRPRPGTCHVGVGECGRCPQTADTLAPEPPVHRSQQFASLLRLAPALSTHLRELFMAGACGRVPYGRERLTQLARQACAISPHLHPNDRDARRRFVNTRS